MWSSLFTDTGIFLLFTSFSLKITDTVGGTPPPIPLIYPVTVKSANLLTSELPCSSPLSGGAMSGRASRSKVRKSGVLVPCHYPELLGPTRALVMPPQHRNRARCLQQGTSIATSRCATSARRTTRAARRRWRRRARSACRHRRLARVSLAPAAHRLRREHHPRRHPMRRAQARPHRRCAGGRRLRSSARIAMTRATHDQ